DGGVVRRCEAQVLLNQFVVCPLQHAVAIGKGVVVSADGSVGLGEVGSGGGESVEHAGPGRYERRLTFFALRGEKGLKAGFPLRAGGRLGGGGVSNRCLECGRLLRQSALNPLADFGAGGGQLVAELG